MEETPIILVLRLNKDSQFQVEGIQHINKLWHEPQNNNIIFWKCWDVAVEKNRFQVVGTLNLCLMMNEDHYAKKCHLHLPSPVQDLSSMFSNSSSLDCIYQNYKLIEKPHSHNQWSTPVTCMGKNAWCSGYILCGGQ